MAGWAVVRGSVESESRESSRSDSRESVGVSSVGKSEIDEKMIIFVLFYLNMKYGICNLNGVFLYFLFL